MHCLFLHAEANLCWFLSNFNKTMKCREESLFSGNSHVWSLHQSNSCVFLIVAASFVSSQVPSRAALHNTLWDKSNCLMRPRQGLSPELCDSYQTTPRFAHLKPTSGYSQLYLAATIPANNRQHLLAYWWRGGGGQLFKCDRWSLVSGCCCCCSFPRILSRPQRGWEEQQPQHSSAGKLSVAAQSVSSRRTNRRPLLCNLWF